MFSFVTEVSTPLQIGLPSASPRVLLEVNRAHSPRRCHRSSDGLASNFGLIGSCRKIMNKLIPQSSVSDHSCDGARQLVAWWQLELRPLAST